MILPSFFEISAGFWSTKKLIRLGLHASPRTLCSMVGNITEYLAYFSIFPIIVEAFCMFAFKTIVFFPKDVFQRSVGKIKVQNYFFGQ